MQYPIALLLASAGIVAAQVSTTASAATSGSTNTGCQAENIVQACLASTGTRVTACPQTDYACLCSAYQDQLTCYNNCPNDQGRYTVQAQVTSYCTAASGLSSQSAAAATTGGSSSAASSGSSATDSSATTATSSESSASSSASAASASSSSVSTGLAQAVQIPAGSMLAIALGLVGML